MQLRTKLKKGGEAPPSFYSQLATRLAEHFDKGDIVVTVHRVPPVRYTEHVRRYYWSLNRLVHAWLVEHGHNEISLDDVHQMHKERFMSRQFVDYLANQVYDEQVSTTLLEPQEWYPILEQIKLFWAEKGLYLPDRGNDVEYQRP